jgi:N utilization substance protein B
VKPRRLARTLAMQALYEIDAVGHNAETVLGHRFEAVELPLDYQRFVRELVWGVLNNREDLDELLCKHAPAWPLEEIALLDRNIIRIAIFELLFDVGTPARVAINEAVELAKRYGNESTRRFVNGVLGSVAAELERSGRLAKHRVNGSHVKSTSVEP